MTGIIEVPCNKYGAGFTFICYDDTNNEVIDIFNLPAKANSILKMTPPPNKKIQKNRVNTERVNPK